MGKFIYIIETIDKAFPLFSNYLSELNFPINQVYKYINRHELLHTNLSDAQLFIFCTTNDTDSLDTLEHLHEKHITIPIIVLSADGSVANAVKAIKAGASDFLHENELNKEILEQAIISAIGENKIYENKLLEYAEYKKHFYMGPVPVCIVDMNTLKFLEVNNAAIETYQYTREEFLNMTITALRPNEEKEDVQRSFYNIANNQYDAGYWKHTKKNGETFHVHIYTQTTYFKNKEARISFIVDVNDILMAEKQNQELSDLIKDQKEQLDNILFSISDVIWSRTADTFDLTYANNAYYKMFGYHPDEVMNNSKYFLNSIHPEDLQIFIDSMNAAKSIGPTKVEYRYCHKDGTIKILQAHVTFKKGKDNKPDTLNGVTVDITKERTLQERIRKSEQNLLATINNTRDLIWSVNTDLEIIFCNRPYQDFIYDIAGIVPKPGDYVLGEWGSESFINTRRKDYERALKGDSFTEIVEEIFEGDILCKEISSNPIIDHFGTIIGVNCIARDISEQRRQYMKIQEQNNKLTEIAWIQSHKVRGPVASILGLAELFNYNPNEYEYNYEIIDRIKQATNDLDTIIREIVKKTSTLKKA